MPATAHMMKTGASPTGVAADHEPSCALRLRDAAGHRASMAAVPVGGGPRDFFAPSPACSCCCRRSRWCRARPARTPSPPSMTARVAASSATIETTRSSAAGKPRQGVSITGRAGVANGAARAGLRPRLRSANPPAYRLAAIAAPIAPSPMNTMVICVLRRSVGAGRPGRALVRHVGGADLIRRPAGEAGCRS